VARLPDSFFEAVREAVTVGDVLARHGFAPIERRGPCPVCASSAGGPFSVRERGRFARCFANCARGFDAIGLEAALGGGGRAQAAERIALAAGIPTHHPTSQSPEAEAEARRKAAARRLAGHIQASLERGRWQLAAATHRRLTGALAALHGVAASPLAWDMIGGLRERAAWAFDAMQQDRDEKGPRRA